jgi:voltage-gated potassium channel
MPNPGFMRRVHHAFHHPDDRAYRIVETTVWILIVISVALFVYETATGQLQSPAPLLDTLDSVVLWLFGIELTLRFLSFRPAAADFLKPTARKWWSAQLFGRLRYLFTPLMLVDLLTVLAVVPALRALRAVRLLRLLRTARIFQYSSPYQGVLRTFQENGLLYLAVATFLMSSVVVGGLSFFLAEAAANPQVNNIGDGMWWALVTLTTVGYGDLTPITATGKVFGGALMVAGMFTLALFAGTVGSTLLRTMIRMREDQFRMTPYINHIVVCGYDPSARMLLDALLTEVRGDAHSDIVLFATGERPHDLSGEFVWVQGDPTKESELAKARIRYARSVIVVGNRQLSPSEADARTILSLFTIGSWMRSWPGRSERRAPLYVVAEVLDAENVEHAHTAGADEVIQTARLGFNLLAHAAITPGSAEVMGRVVAAGALSLYIAPNPYPGSMTFGDLAHRLREEHRAALIGAGPTPTDIELLLKNGDPISATDSLAYLADHRHLTPLPDARKSKALDAQGLPAGSATIDPPPKGG